MPCHARQNLYPGINAHLQHLLAYRQDDSPSGWPSFHADHISQLTGDLNEVLPSGYIAITEQALQIKTLDLLWSDSTIQHPKPDSSIYQLRPNPATSAIIDWATPTFKFEIEEIDIEDILPSVAIYEVQNHSVYGQPITRIELLSPSNKPGGSAYMTYFQNRAKALRSGTALVEIDYFHASPSPIFAIFQKNAYPDPTTYPYNIIVSRPITGHIDTEGFSFGVADPFPSLIPMPLANGDILPFNLGEVYMDTFRRGRWGELIDYAIPLAASTLATFRPDDQAKLEALRQQIIAAHFTQA